jgi:mannose-6-phosphate isomerase-like protein (cupin superfamily)
VALYERKNMTENEYKRDWSERGYSFGVGTIYLDKGVDKAVHNDQDEVVVAVNGKLEFTIDNKTFVAETDTEVFIPAKSIHSIKNVGTEISKIYYGYKQSSI